MASLSAKHYKDSAVCHKKAHEQLMELIRHAGLTRRGFCNRLQSKDETFHYDERSIGNWKRGFPRKDGLLFAIAQVLTEETPAICRCNADEVLSFLALAGFPFADVNKVAPLFPPADFHAALRKYLPLFEGISDDTPFPNHHLPMYGTGFIGREKERETVKQLLLKHRLLTLWGIGGCGKTRLALELAEDIKDEFRHGVCFVDLSAVHDPTLVPLEIAYALNIEKETDSLLDTSLIPYLAPRHGLLILDNFEQVIESAPLVTTLLESAPFLHVLVTSREPLCLPIEQQYEILPLSLPDPELCPPDWETHQTMLLQSQAIQLFVALAQVAKFDFALTPDNASAVVEICIAQGGLPLGIELAARRVGTLSPQAMLAYIHDPLALAEGTIRHVPERQQSIAASFDWSYNLLETSEQLLFNRLSVFAGGFTIAAVTEVCTDEHILAIQVLSAIESLIQKSLLRLKDMMSREPRITILEPVREYAFKRLHERGETSTLFHRHAHYYLKLAEEAAPELKGSRQESWLRRLEDEHGNIRAALHRLIEDGEAETALRFCVALELFWYWRGYRQEERLWLKRILASSSLSDAARAKALDEAGGIAWAQGDYDEAKHLSGQSLELWKKLDHTEGMLEALNTLGLVAESQGELEQAIALHEQGLVLRRRLNNPFRVAIALGNLGDAELYHQPAQPERAIERFKESFWLYQSLEDRNGMAGMLVSLGDAALFLGDYIRAIAQFRQSLVLYQQVGNANRNRLARCLERLAAVFLALDDAERSAHLLGAAATLRKEYHLPCPPIYSFHCEQTLNTTRHHLGEAAFQVAYTSGKVMSCEDAIAYALDAPVSPVTLCRWKQPEIAHWQIERPTAAEGPMARAALVSPLAIPLTPCQVVIPSWHATTPPGTWIEVYLRARIEQRWTRYYRMVRWDSALEQSQRCSFDAQSDADGSVETETLSLAVSVQVVQARVVLCSTSTDIWPELHALQLCLSAQPQSQAGGERRNISSSPPQSAPTLNIPSFSQYQYPHGKEWCSPTALAMVLGYWHTQTGDDVLQPCATPESVPELIAPLVYDVNYGMGNWSFNTACAVGFGLEAYVTRLLSVQQIARWIAAGVPVICSLAWKSGELENAPIPSSNGHLVVVVGVQAEGWVAVADPAGHDPTQVQRWYRAEQFMACWQRHSAGTVYLIYPPGWKIPTPRSDDAWA